MYYINMDIIILTPTLAKITKISESEKHSLTKQCSFKNSSVEYLIKKHSENFFWKRKNYDSWSSRLDDLKKEQYQNLLKYENGFYYINTGYLPYIEDIKINIIENHIVYKSTKPIPWFRKPEYELRDCQEEAIEALLKAKHGAISLPTGVGKSDVLLHLAKRLGNRVVVVTPSQSIFTELYTRFKDMLGDKYVGVYGDGKKKIGKQITVCIGKSLTMIKKDTEAWDFFTNADCLLIDEAHSWGSEELHKVSQNIMSEVPYRMFVSATQTRGDGTEKLLQSIIGPIVYEMPIIDAINKGYLAPLKFTILRTVSNSTENPKDAKDIQRVHFLHNDKIARLIADIVNKEGSEGRSSLILVEELAQISRILPMLTVPTGYVHAGSKLEAEKFNLQKVDPQEQILKFNKGEVKVLIGTRAISTGTNLFPTHNTFNWVGGGSEIATKQGTMGRSTRLLELSKFKQYHPPKPYSMIYDFDVINNNMLLNQLKKRILFYREAGTDFFIKNTV